MTADTKMRKLRMRSRVKIYGVANSDAFGYTGRSVAYNFDGGALVIVADNDELLAAHCDYLGLDVDVSRAQDILFTRPANLHTRIEDSAE